MEPFSAILGFLSAAGSAVASGASAVGGAIASGAEALGGAVASGAEAVGGAVTKGASTVGDISKKALSAAVNPETWKTGAQEFVKGVAGNEGVVAKDAKGATEWGKTLARAAGRGTRTAGAAILGKALQKRGSSIVPRLAKLAAEEYNR